MDAKQGHYIFGMLGLAAFAIFYFLYRSQAPAAASSSSVEIPVPTGGPAYPAASPINLGDVTINDGLANSDLTGNVPLNGNLLPSVKVGSGNGACGCDDTCDAGVFISVPSIPTKVLQSAVENLKSYKKKIYIPNLSA